MFGLRSYQYMEEDSSGSWFKKCQEKSITHTIIINENEVKAYLFMSFRSLRSLWMVMTWKIWIAKIFRILL